MPVACAAPSSSSAVRRSDQARLVTGGRASRPSVPDRWLDSCVSARGTLIRDAILALPIAQQLSLHFIDLGEQYSAGFARSLLEARDVLRARGRPFLLCTADHIFDAAIIREMASYRIEGPPHPLGHPLDAVALVEADVASVGGLPPTAVRVRLAPSDVGDHPSAARPRPEGPLGSRPLGSRPLDESALGAGGGSSGDGSGVRRVTAIGKSVGGATDGIEAGLYLCSSRVFDALEDISVTRGYFTLAQAMASLAAVGRLGALLTAGRAWFAIETLDQANTPPARDTRPPHHSSGHIYTMLPARSPPHHDGHSTTAIPPRSHAHRASCGFSLSVVGCSARVHHP